MPACWVLKVLFVISMVTLSLSQSGDGEWGSGDIPHSVLTHNTTRELGDEPTDSRAPPVTGSNRGSCSALFHTCPGPARWLRVQREELSYLRAIQHGNQAVMENLIQYVSAEMGEQRYQDLIQDNVVGIREDHLSCQGVVQKITDNLETQLEGEALETLGEAQKIKEESLAFEEMLRAAADIANKLEVSFQALRSSFTKQLKKTQVGHR
ncbi:hypothetical protein AAFF_G00241780 [Aldrovandia affinis]|uniref:Uncharacterized protein n=1 Tax=Aldrovandia affinis TaxID=143900 RepID=A0AAD7SUR1_9TELE|nr:hypothetical protein AAFF_G00241780 [Aldrovandia affinis]